MLESLTWAALNWLLDAASLWCFVAAFGRIANPVELFAAYGIANVAGALPVTPAGLGVVDSVTPLLLVTFGVTRNVATLGVLGWRLVNFWMPIPAGALAYVSLKVPRGAGLWAMRQAVSGMMSHATRLTFPSQVRTGPAVRQTITSPGRTERISGQPSGAQRTAVMRRRFPRAGVKRRKTERGTQPADRQREIPWWVTHRERGWARAR